MLVFCGFCARSASQLLLDLIYTARSSSKDPTYNCENGPVFKPDQNAPHHYYLAMFSTLLPYLRSSSPNR